MPNDRRSRGASPAAGDRLDGRYRLVRPARAPGEDSDGPPALWLARDEVLARPVAARLLPAGGQGGTQAQDRLLAAAAAAGAVSHPVLARVYDAAREPVPVGPPGAGETVDVAYVISEWVEGPTLGAVLVAEGPWEAARACALVSEVLEALAVAHAAGLVHGRVHPGNLLLPAGGRVRLTDLALSASLPGRSVPAARTTDPEPRAADVRDLAAVLYALLTGRWPSSATPQPAGLLAAAPAGRDGQRGRLTGPAQVRAGVPRRLDSVVVRALDPLRAQQAPDLSTAAGLCDALDPDIARDTARGPARGPARDPAPAPHAWSTAPRSLTPRALGGRLLGGRLLGGLAVGGRRRAAR